MRRIYTAIVLLLFAIGGHAQHWVEVGNLNANYTINALCTDAAGNVYAAGGFTDSSDPSGGHRFVAKYDGIRWQTLGDTAHALRANGSIYALTADAMGNVYAAGNFTDSNSRTYVAMWNGTNWLHLGFDTSGLNSWNPIYTLAADNGHVYAAGAIQDSVFAYGHYYVAVWDGYWHELGLDTTSGLNANGAIYSICAGPQHQVYAAGAFTDTNGHYYVGVYNGTSWSPLGIGAAALHANNFINSVTTDKAGNVYAAGSFTDTAHHYYIAKWDGTSWSKLQSANDQITVLGPIYALTVDSAGNVFGSGNIPDSNGNYVTVIKWDGNSLTEAGGLNANDAILSLAADAHGNVFAAGNFKDAAFTQYVAAYTTTILPTSINDINPSKCIVYPNPAKGILNVMTTANATVELRDMEGRLMYSTDADGHAAIDISAIAAGMYLLNVRTADGANSTVKVIKE